MGGGGSAPSVRPVIADPIPGYDAGMMGALGMGRGVVDAAIRATPELRTADIDALQKMANREALINALKSAEMEKFLTPEVARMRELYDKQMLEDFEGGPSKELSNLWLKQGISDIVATGANLGSGFARSALADKTRRDYFANRMMQQDRTANYLAGNPMPIAGLDVGGLAGMSQQAKNENAAARDAYQSQVLGFLGAQAGNVTNAFQQWSQMEAARRAQNAQAINQANAINAQNAAAASGNSSAMWGAGLGAAGAIGGAAIVAF